MGLGLDIGSFLKGVQERSAEIDKDLADRIETLSEKKDDDTLKTLFADEVTKYEEDEDKIQAIKSAQAAGDWRRAQFLLSGYENIEDYDKAATLAERQGTALHFEMPTLGKKPVFTKADYGVTNIRDDGSQITTAGRMFDKLFRPDVAKKREGELSGTPTDAEYTTYRRGKTAEAIEGPDSTMPDSKAKVADMIKNLTSAGKYEGMEDSHEINFLNDKKELVKQTFKKTDDAEWLDSAAADLVYKQIGIRGYMPIGTEVYVDNDKLAQGLRYLGQRPEQKEGESEADFKQRTQEYNYLYNATMFSTTVADKLYQGKPPLNFVLNGLYDKKGNLTSVIFTDNPEDVFMEGTDFAMVGYRQLGGTSEKVETPALNSTIKIWNANKKSWQLIRYTGRDEDFETPHVDHLGIIYPGYAKQGDPEKVKADSPHTLTLTIADGYKVTLLETGNPKDKVTLAEYPNKNDYEIGLEFDEAVKKYQSYERTGWVYFTEPVAPKLSVAESEFAPYKIILEAMKNGETVDQWVLDSAELMKNKNVGASEQMYQNMLKTWDNTVVSVMDFSHLTVNEYDGNGNKVMRNDKEVRVPASQANIARASEITGVSIEAIRKGLLNQHHADNPELVYW